MSFYFGFSVIVAGAGVGAPLTFVVATVSILLVANTVAEFSKYRRSAGSFVTFITITFGPVVGAAMSLFAIVGYGISAASVVAVAGGWTHDTIRRFLSIDTPWQAFAIAAVAVCGVLAIRGVRVSTFWAGVFFYFELVLLLGVAMVLLVVHRHAINYDPLLPSSVAGGVSGIGLGFPLAVYMFVGWENSVTLAEETRDPGRNIPRTLVVATLFMGLLYVFVAYATEIAFHNDVGLISASPIPLIDAVTHSVPIILPILYIAGLTSIFSCLLSLINSQSRILFDAGREGYLSAYFAVLHKSYHTPTVAIWTYICFICSVVVILGFWFEPTEIFLYTGTLGTIPIIIVYLITTFALPIHVIRNDREHFSASRHFVGPLVGFLMTCFPLWSLVNPSQPAPFNSFPWMVIAGLLASSAYAIVWWFHQRNVVSTFVVNALNEEASLDKPST